MNVKEFSIHVFHCSVIKVPVSFWQLWYFIISLCACQELMTIKNLFLIVLFFKVFCFVLKSFFLNRIELFVVCCRFCDSHIRLPYLFWLVNNFFHNIWKFHFHIIKICYQSFPYRISCNLFTISQVPLIVNNFFHNILNCVNFFEILWYFLSLIGDS